MILLATNQRDITTDFIVLELQKRDITYFRLNTENIAQYKIQIDIHGGDFLISTDKGDWLVDKFVGAYFRRPEQPIPPIKLARPHADYVIDEWSAILRTLWNRLNSKWLNCPFAIQQAEDKPRQLIAAKAAGLNVPLTHFTNDFDLASKFLVRNSGIAKPIRHSLLEDNGLPEEEKVIFTSRIEKLSDEQRASFSLAPVIVQAEVPKKYDIRVTVVDDIIFPVRIDSQSRPDTTVDWRTGSRTDLQHSKTNLPDDVGLACVSVVKSLGLRFAAIDLVEDVDGQFWFLEANPNGQWAWIERRTGHKISAAIVDALVDNDVS